MFALDRSSRAVLAGTAFAAFAGALVTTPIVARGAAGLAMTSAPLARPTASPAAFAVVLPRRDPFAGDAPPRRSTAAPAPGAALAPLSMPTAPNATIAAAFGPLPANAGAAGAPFPSAVDRAQSAANMARVTAVVTGAHPYALVDEAGTTRVVTLGDRVANGTIAAISRTAVRLADGTVLTVTPAAPIAPPAPPAPAASPVQPSPEMLPR